MNEQKIIVAFHIGRGGRYNNQGHKSFMPYVSKLSDCINYEKDTIISQDENGNELPDKEWKLIDGGNIILEGRDAIESDTGVLNWDNDYDTDIVQYLDECSQDELEIIYQAYLDGEYMPYELKDYICEAMGLHRIDNIKFYQTNAEVHCNDCILTFNWDGEKDVTEEDAKEWMEENNIDPISIKNYADDFEQHFYND